MSKPLLLTPGVGVLDTHVTMEDIEECLRKALGTTARFGPNVTPTHLGAGKGFLSRIALLEPQWRGAAPGEDLPQKVAIKLPTCLAAEVFDDADAHPDVTPEMKAGAWEFFASFLRQMHNVECCVYNFFERIEADLPIARAFYNVPFTEENIAKGQLALHVIEDSSTFHLHEHLSLQQMRQAARAIGRIQAAAHRYGFSEVEGLRKRDPYKAFWNSLPKESYVGLFLATKHAGASEHFTQIIDSFLDLLPEYHGSNLPMTYCQQTGMTPVIVHGDLWTSNVLISSSTNNVVAIVDWQLAHAGSGAEDLLRLAFAAMRPNDRREHFDELLEEMHSAMVEGSDGKPPYSLEELQTSARVLFTHAAFFLGGVMIPMLLASLKTTCEKISDEERQRRKNVVLEKVESILEDALVHHQKNQGEKLRW